MYIGHENHSRGHEMCILVMKMITVVMKCVLSLTFENMWSSECRERARENQHNMSNLIQVSITRPFICCMLKSDENSIIYKHVKDMCIIHIHICLYTCLVYYNLFSLGV